MDFATVARAVTLHYEFQLGTYFDSTHHLPDAIVAVGAVPGCIWNHAAVLPGGEAPDRVWVERVRAWLERLGRPLAVYVELHMADTAERLLTEFSLQHVDTEAWMFYRGAAQDWPLSYPYTLRKVAAGSQAASVDTLIAACFNEDHGNAVRNEQRPDGLRRSGFRLILTDADQAVGAATVFYADGWAVIHDVCIDPSLRGRGLGVEMMSAVVQSVQPLSPSGLFLQCECGPLEDFYRRCGFETRYTRLGYATEKPA
jgi:GNAT superfamily N-acetyltransferase